MCKAKADGERCFYHAWSDFQQNAERIERDTRILTNGQKLTKDEEYERRELAEHDPEVLSQKEKNRLSVLERIREDNSELTAVEQRHYNNNLKRREELDAALNSAAVAGGATKRKELALLRGDILFEFARNDPNAKHHKSVHIIREFLERRKDDPDTPLTRREMKVADEIYLADPEQFNSKHEMTDGNGRRSALTEEKYRERLELVRRYETLNPALANPEHQNAHVLITRMRRTQKTFKIVVDSVILKRPLPDEVVASLPEAHAAAYRSGKLTPRIITLAVAHDERMAAYAFYAERAKAFPRLYNKSSDREAMDNARKLVRADPEELTASRLAARQKRVDEWTARIQRGEWARQEEVKFATVVSPTQPLVPPKPAANPKQNTVTSTPAKASTPVPSTSASSGKAPTVQKTAAVPTPASTPSAPTGSQPAASAKGSATRVTTRQPQAPVSATPAPPSVPQVTRPPAEPVAKEQRVAKPAPALPPHLAGGSLQRSSVMETVDRQPVADPPAVPSSNSSVTPPPVVGGDDFLHRLQRIFKRGN